MSGTFGSRKSFLMEGEKECTLCNDVGTDRSRKRLLVHHPSEKGSEGGGISLLESENMLTRVDHLKLERPGSYIRLKKKKERKKDSGGAKAAFGNHDGGVGGGVVTMNRIKKKKKEWMPDIHLHSGSESPSRNRRKL